MQHYWVSWWSGNYADEGCTAPPFKFFVTGYRERPDNGMTIEQQALAKAIEDEDDYDDFINNHSRDDCSICAEIVAEDEDAVWKLVEAHFPDYDQRFCDPCEPGAALGSRFQQSDASS